MSCGVHAGYWKIFVPWRNLRFFMNCFQTWSRYMMVQWLCHSDCLQMCAVCVCAYTIGECKKERVLSPYMIFSCMNMFLFKLLGSPYCLAYLQQAKSMCTKGSQTLPRHKIYEEQRRLAIKDEVRISLAGPVLASQYLLFKFGYSNFRNCGTANVFIAILYV